MKARFVILAGNGYLPNLERKVAARVMPLNSFIGATEPLGARADDIMGQDIAVHDSKWVANYFRLSEDKRLLFGGRPSYSLGFPDGIATLMRKRILNIFPQLEGVKLDYAWGGTLGVTIPRMPAIIRVAPNTMLRSSVAAVCKRIPEYRGAPGGCDPRAGDLRSDRASGGCFLFQNHLAVYLKSICVLFNQAGICQLPF